jgi:hypothetical protein
MSLFSLEFLLSFQLSNRSRSEHLEARTAFGLLTIEFWLYAMRHPSTKARFARRFSIVRVRLADRSPAAIANMVLSLDGRQTNLAPMVLALDAGLFIQHLAEPDAIGPQLRAQAIIELVDPETP